MNKIIKNTIIITVITLIAGILLGFVYEITKGPIAIAQENAKEKAYKQVFTNASKFQNYDDFDAAEASSMLNDAGNKSTINEVVIATDGSDDLGYVITVTNGDGYAGDIKFSVGIQKDGTVNGIAILSIGETAGLGMKAKEPAFKDQFSDKKVEQFEVTKTGAAGDEQIDALSGATITSRAMTNGVNAALLYFQNILGGGSTNE
ncbi:MAG: RnfABCDGE type electron transport complex subunit G [Lachnospiraceae bacterium]|nr:RnfABCDGE type electron transport complex subunit G [Lachnospiraceae bacterium]